MSIMPEPTKSDDRINDTRTPAERLLDDTMRRWAAEHNNWLDQIELRLAALRALEAWGTDSPEAAARLLQSWARRPEMTDASVADVLDALFPPADLIQD